MASEEVGETVLRMFILARLRVSDGVLYATSSWSVVYAIDARHGTVRWRYDPAVPKEHAKFVCCDVVNRGVALFGDKVYVGTIDGRLIALDRKTGAPMWSRYK